MDKAFLAAYVSYSDGKYRAAQPLLRRATQDAPQSFAAWFAVWATDHAATHVPFVAFESGASVGIGRG